MLSLIPKGILALGFSLLLVTPSALAQSEVLFCPITHLQNTATGQRARLHCGVADGLSAQSQARHLFQRYEEGVRNSKAYAAEKLSFYRLGDIDAEVDIQQKADSTETLQVGDLVVVDVNIPDIPADQTLFRLSLLHVIFQQQMDVPIPWVQYRDYLRQPDYDFQNERLEAMLEEIYEISAFADETAGTEPIVGGRFEGLTLKEAMLESTVEDLADFFLFVEAFPGKYMGHIWKLPEVYATWIINKTPGPDDKNVEEKDKEE